MSQLVLLTPALFFQYKTWPKRSDRQMLRSGVFDLKLQLMVASASN